MSTPREDMPTERVTVTDDADEFILAVPGVSGTVVRTGRGDRSMTVTARGIDAATVALLEFGYPMVGGAAPDGDVLVLCQMLRTPRGGRWNGVELEVGQTFVYPPGSSQVAADPEGLAFGLVAVPWAQVEAAADAMGFAIRVDSSAQVLAPSVDRPLCSLFSAVTATGTPCSDEGAVLEGDTVLEAVARSVGHAAAKPGSTSSRRGLSSDDLVRDAIDILQGWSTPGFADSDCWIRGVVVL